MIWLGGPGECPPLLPSQVGLATHPPALIAVATICGSTAASIPMWRLTRRGRAFRLPTPSRFTLLCGEIELLDHSSVNREAGPVRLAAVVADGQVFPAASVVGLPGTVGGGSCRFILPRTASELLPTSPTVELLRLGLVARRRHCRSQFGTSPVLDELASCGPIVDAELLVDRARVRLDGVVRHVQLLSDLGHR